MVCVQRFTSSQNAPDPGSRRMLPPPEMARNRTASVASHASQHRFEWSTAHPGIAGSAKPRRAMQPPQVGRDVILAIDDWYQHP